MSPALVEHFLPPERGLRIGDSFLSLFAPGVTSQTVVIADFTNPSVFCAPPPSFIICESCLFSVRPLVPRCPMREFSVPNVAYDAPGEGFLLCYESCHWRFSLFFHIRATPLLPLWQIGLCASSLFNAVLWLTVAPSASAICLYFKSAFLRPPLSNFFHDATREDALAHQSWKCFLSRAGLFTFFSLFLPQLPRPSFN